MWLLFLPIKYKHIKLMDTSNEVHFLQRLVVEMGGGLLPVPNQDPGTSVGKVPQKQLQELQREWP